MIKGLFTALTFLCLTLSRVQEIAAASGLTPGASLVNVNFGHNDSIKVGKAAIGVSDTDFWNHYSFPYLSFGSITNLQAADGTATTMGLTAVDGPGQWYNMTGDKMYDSYLYSDSDITVTLYDVPSGNYNIVIYGHGIADSFNTAFQVTSSDVDYGIQATTRTAAWNSVAWQRNIQYVLYENVVATNGTIVITCRHDGLGRAAINGIQLQLLDSRGAFISQQPRSVITQPGSDATFTVVASGESLSYQWRHAGTNLTESAHFVGVNAATLKVVAVDDADAGEYSVMVTGGSGDIASAPASLTLASFSLLNLNFGHQNQVKVGIAATGLSSEDFWNHYTFPFATFASMTNLQMASHAPSNIGLVVENGPGQWSFGATTGDLMYDSYIYSSGTIKATVYNLPAGAYDLYLYGHSDADTANSVFSVASGSLNFGAQSTTTTPGAWKSVNWQNGVQYVLFENLQTSSEPLVITASPGAYGQAFFNGMQIRFRGNVPPGPPTIVQQPKSVTVSETRRAEFSVAAWGVGVLSYQWRHEGTNLPGATTAGLVIPATTPADAGVYDVVVTGSEGSTTSGTVTLTVEGADLEAPIVTITSPLAGPRASETYSLEGTVSDNQKVVSVVWELNGTPKGPLTITDGKFKLTNLSLIPHVDNRIRVIAKDDFDNTGVAELTTYWEAPRVFVLSSPSPVQEGARITVPISLVSSGDVSGATFVVSWNTNDLADAVFQWSDSLSGAFTTEALELNRRYRASFALPAVAVESGTTTVATVTFRARSVADNRVTPVTLELIDVYGATGDQFTTGNDYRSGAVSVTKRKFKGDNNANDRLDVGDASVIMLLIGTPALRRSWDISGNDLNGNATIDSGDVIKVLRAVVGLDPQPTVAAADIGKKAQTALTTINVPPVGPSDPVTILPVDLIADKKTAAPGEKVTLYAVVGSQSKPISGASFRLKYPVDALRLDNATAHQVGSLVPAGAVALWNVSPSQNNYATQDGTISLAVSSASAGSTYNGVLAQFTFTVQAGATARYGWPVQLENVEVSRDGFTTDLLGNASWTFIGHAPTDAAFAPAISFNADGSAKLTLRGDVGASYRVEASNDLVHWAPVGTYYSADGSIDVDDSAGNGAGPRFYKATLIQ
jgi:hypothetical protein